MKTVLIITTAHDVGADFIIKELRKRKEVRVVRFNTEEYPEKTRIKLIHDDKGKLEIIFDFYNQGTVKSSDIFSAYYRREGEPVLNKDIKKKENILFARTEIIGALDTVWDTLNCKWVNHPRYSTSLMTKVAQTHYSGLTGFLVPKTIVTTSYKEVLNFYENCNGQMIAKQLGNARGAIDWIEGRLYTQKIHSKDLELFKNAKYAPVMLQEAIEKEFELRITVVGNKMFAVKIDSQSNKNTLVDWRKGPIGEVSHEEFKLPKDIERKLLKLHKKLNLAYSGTDMIVTPKGDFVLLELNPNGEYVWTEVLTGLKITKAIADYLLEERRSDERGGNPSLR